MKMTVSIETYKRKRAWFLFLSFKRFDKPRLHPGVRSGFAGEVEMTRDSGVIVQITPD